MSEPHIVVATPPVGAPAVEAEHALQYKLLGEVERLLAERNLDRALEVLRSLYDYSEAHFASEQVLMRLHSYPGYEAHEREHGEVLAALETMTHGIDEATAASSADALRRWLTSHVQHWDLAFVQHMKVAPLGSADTA